jgi:hypothetical protein
MELPPSALTDVSVESTPNQSRSEYDAGRFGLV